MYLSILVLHLSNKFLLHAYIVSVFSRVGARGVSSGYARTEAEFEQIIDGINEQEVRY